MQVVEFEQPTRTSAEAAAAIGCSVAEIAKSVVFRGRESGLAVVVVASGANRVCEKRLPSSAKLGRADADFVRESTGYVIGGVSPLGHAKPVKLVLDEDLQQFETEMGAAGTPFSVFPLTPEKLCGHQRAVGPRFGWIEACATVGGSGGRPPLGRSRRSPLR